MERSPCLWWIHWMRKNLNIRTKRTALVLAIVIPPDFGMRSFLRAPLQAKNEGKARRIE
jgi:hypothetical protein